jgi:hypothetical protein
MASQMVTGAIIKRRAIQFAEALNIIEFNASEGWLSNFKKRNHIKEYKRQGEAASAPLEEIPKFQAKLQEVIKEYRPEDVYNADETGLYWRMEPDKTLAMGPISGKKKAKDRITILLTCSATGDKLPPLLIYKFRNPDLFAISISLPCQYIIIGIVQLGCKCPFSITTLNNSMVKCDVLAGQYFLFWITPQHMHLKKAILHQI